jgi:hypothetical protein
VSDLTVRMADGRPLPLNPKPWELGQSLRTTILRRLGTERAGEFIAPLALFLDGISKATDNIYLKEVDHDGQRTWQAGGGLSDRFIPSHP